MGSVAVPPSAPIEFHLTGFKKFYNVAENPTEVLMGKVEEFVKDGVLPSGSTIGSCTVLETAGAGGLKFLLNLFDSEGSSASPDSKFSGGKLDAVPQILEEPRQVVWIHFGVDSGASRLKIEKRAVNEATFRCPDEMGWQPVGERIVEEDGSLSNIRETVFSVHDIAADLVKLGFDAVVSYDAGLFVCNYVYYQSLRHAANNGTKSLFVHVPPFTVIAEHIQLDFIASLLKVLAASLL